MTLKNIQVIGFDLDNTLYPSTDEMQGRIRKVIYERLAVEMDMPVRATEELFEENYNGNFQWSHSGSRTIEELGRMVDRSLDGKEVVQQAIEQADILDLIQPNPELNKMLGRLKQDYDLDLISGTSYALVFAKLQRVGIEKEVFENISADRKFGSKTTGEVYQHWIQQRQTSPNQMLYVGDNKRQDVDSPKKLEILTCIVGKPYDNADYHIKDILELETLLK